MKIYQCEKCKKVIVGKEELRLDGWVELIAGSVDAAKEKHVQVVTAGGGVVANAYLREQLTRACEKNGLKLVLPEKRFCTDNAAMIAAEGLVQYGLGNFADMQLTAKASIPLAATLKTVQNKNG